MDRKNFFYGLTATREILNGAFDQVQNRIQQYHIDNGVWGVAQSPFRSGDNHFEVVANNPADLTVKIKPGTGYTKDGVRINIDTEQTFDLSAFKPAAPVSGENKVSVALFLVPETVNSDQRIDADGNTVFVNQAASYKFEAESSAITTSLFDQFANLRSDAILIADVRMNSAWPVIEQSDIKVHRKEHQILSSRFIQPEHSLIMPLKSEGTLPVFTDRITGRNVFRENCALAWATFDISNMGINDAIQPDDADFKSGFNVREVYKQGNNGDVFVTLEPYVAKDRDNCICIANINTPGGSATCQPITAAENANFFGAQVKCRDAGGLVVEPTVVNVVFFGLPDTNIPSETDGGYQLLRNRTTL